MEETKKKLFVERDGFWTETAMLLIALSTVFRLIGSIGRWHDMQYLTTQVALPILCGLLLILCLLLFGKRAFWTTVVPVAVGVVFFIFRAMNMENEWLRGCWIIVYLVIMVLYAMVFSYPKLKWALALVLLAVFAYHIGLMDLPKLMDLENPVSFVDGMEEMSVLGTILAMLSLSFAMKAAPKAAKGKAAPEPEKQPEPEAQPVPAAEALPAVQEEKKLSRREKRKLEKQQKLEEKKRGEEKPETLPEEKREEPQAASEPAETVPAEETPAEAEPLREQEELTEEPEKPQEAETIPAAEESPSAAQTEIAIEEIPVEESFRAEPAAAFPLEESTVSTEENEPAREDGLQDL